MHDLAKMFLHCLNHWKLETPTQKKLHSQGEDLAAYKQNYTRSVDITSLHRNQKWPQFSRLLTVTIIPKARFLWRLISTNPRLRFCYTFYKLPKFRLTLFNSLEYFSWNNGLLVFSTPENRFSKLSWFLFLILMIYLKMRTDSKHDGIKHEHVIFTQACPRSRQRRARLCQCECFCRSNLWRGGGGFGKLCVPLEKSWLRPVLYCIHHLLASLYQVNLNKLKSQGKGLNSASGKIWV